MLCPRRSRKQFTTQRKFLPRAVPCEWQSSLFSTISGRMRAINLFPDLSSRGPFTFYTGVCISGPIAAHNSLGTCNSLLMSWQFLRSFYRHPPIFQDPWFWHGIQLAQGCNHLAGLPCVKKDFGRRYAFVSRTSTRMSTARGILPPRLAIGYSIQVFFDRMIDSMPKMIKNNKHRDQDSNCSFDFIADVKS